MRVQSKSKDIHDMNCNKRKRKQSDIFYEQYNVILDYKKPDGYWVCSHVESVAVPYTPGVNMKNNHDKAEQMARKLFPGCEIRSVIYC